MKLKRACPTVASTSWSIRGREIVLRARIVQIVVVYTDTPLVVLFFFYHHCIGEAIGVLNFFSFGLEEPVYFYYCFGMSRGQSSCALNDQLSLLVDIQTVANE